MKKTFSRISQMMLAVAAFVIILAGTKVNASARYYGYMYGLTVQTAETSNSITVSWSKPSVTSYYTITGYNVAIGTDSKTASTMVETNPIRLDANTYSYTFTGLNPGTEYNCYVEYSYKTKYGKTDTGSVGHGDIRTTPATVTGLNQDKWWRWAKNVDVAWNAQDAVDGYEYIFSESNGKKIDSGIVDSARYSHKISNNIIYKISVRAYSNINGRVYYSDWTPDCYLMIQPSRADSDAEVNAKIRGGKMTVSWKKLKGASGYNVYVSTRLDGGFKKIKSVKANKSSVTAKFGKKKFNPKKTYYIYVQAYKNVAGRKVTTGVNYVTVLKRGKLSFQYAATNGDYK